MTRRHLRNGGAICNLSKYLRKEILRVEDSGETNLAGFLLKPDNAKAHRYEVSS